MNNFRDVVGLFLAAGGALQVASAEELAEAALRLLDQPADARLMEQRAKEVVREQAGAALRIMNQMEEWLGTPQATTAPVH